MRVSRPNHEDPDPELTTPIFAFVLFGAFPIPAQSTWTGGGGTADWSDNTSGGFIGLTDAGTRFQVAGAGSLIGILPPAWGGPFGAVHQCVDVSSKDAGRDPIPRLPERATLAARFGAFFARAPTDRVCRLAYDFRMRNHQPILRRSSMRTLPSLLALSLVVLLPLHYLRAAWILLEDFDTLSVGDVNGQGTWVADNGSTTVVVDPLGGPNQVLQSQGSNGGGHPDFGVNTAYMPLPSSIANNTTATLFFRFRLDSISDANASFGLSDSATPSLDFNFTDYEVQAGAAAGNVRVRDQGSFETVTQSGSFNSDIWYSSWLVVDNAADTWSWYVLGGSFLTQATLDSGVDAINFRNGTAANALQSILIKAGTIPSSTVWYDDFHLDTTGENLSEPFGVTAQYLLPEPSTFVGLILGSIVLRWSGTRTHRRKSS